MTTRWSSASTDFEYIYVDLGSSFPLCQVVLFWETALGKNFTIDISPDAVTWTTVATITNNTSFTNTISILGTARYVRMNGTLRGTGYGYSLYEFQVYSTNPTPSCPATNIGLGKVAVASSLENAAFPASNAFDGIGTTRWSSQFSDPQYIYVDLGGIFNLCQVVLTWEAAYGKNFTIDASNDLITWTNLATVTGNASLTNTIAVTGAGRYVRMYGTARGTGYGYSLWEFTINGSSILPVNLKSFTAFAAHDAEVILQWKTAQELNNRSFLIERSVDGAHFTLIGTVAGRGTTDLTQDYSFTDSQPLNGKNYYRLKQTDFDGNFTFSDIVPVDIELSTAAASVYPNPVTDILTIHSAAGEVLQAVYVYNFNGALLFGQSSLSSFTQQISLAKYPAGNYLIRIQMMHTNITSTIRKQ